MESYKVVVSDAVTGQVLHEQNFSSYEIAKSHSVKLKRMWPESHYKTVIKTIMEEE